jgi:hypothetical protein
LEIIDDDWVASTGTTPLEDLDAEGLDVELRKQHVGADVEWELRTTLFSEHGCAVFVAAHRVASQTEAVVIKDDPKVFKEALGFVVGMGFCKAIDLGGTTTSISIGLTASGRAGCTVGINRICKEADLAPKI